MAIQTATRPSKRPRAPVDITCPDALLHGNAVQLLVGISATTLRRWVDRGMFPRPMVRIRGRPRWRCETIMDWLRNPRRPDQ